MSECTGDMQEVKQKQCDASSNWGPGLSRESLLIESYEMTGWGPDDNGISGSAKRRIQGLMYS